MIKDDITSAAALDAMKNIAQKHRLLLVVLYGSVARGTETATSDVDIGVLGEEPLTLEDEARISEEFSLALKLPRIEVRGLHRVAPLFLHQVMSDGITLFADTPLRAQELRLYAWKMATETRYLRDRRYARTKARIEAHV